MPKHIWKLDVQQHWVLIASESAVKAECLQITCVKPITFSVDKQGVPVNDREFLIHQILAQV